MTDETQPQDSAAMSPASAGSHGLPVAWAVMQPDYKYVSLLRESAEAAASQEGGTVAPLYRQPKLPDAEQRAIAVAILGSLPSYAATLRNLLERMT